LSNVLLPTDAGEGATPIHAVATADLEGRLAAAPASAASWLRNTAFGGDAGEVALLPGEDGGVAAAWFGLGRNERTPSFLPGKLYGALPPGNYRLGDGWDDPAFATLAFALGAYRFTWYRADQREPRRLVVPAGVDAAEVMRIVAGVYRARDLVNTASNDMGPAELAAAAGDIAAEHGATMNVVSGARLAEGFPLIHAVGAAAIPQRAPRLVDVTWGDASAPKITLVGKGVCFDTGGLDIKPSSSMLLMKKDMGGAANVLGLAHMIMSANLRVRLRVLIPAVENAISGAAFRPGDVLRARDGTTVEIGNTDAEGRLVLADALTLAAEEKPDLIVDLATLPGAARVALGPEIVPVYTHDDGLAADLARHATAVADPVWRMPLWAPYRTMLDSRIADINNAGQGGYAGSITAALFLARFVPEATPWLHADIFAWNPSAKPGRPEGGEAQVIRALYSLLKERYPA